MPTASFSGSEIEPIVSTERALITEDCFNSVVKGIIDAGTHESPIDQQVRRIMFVVFEVDHLITEGPFAGKRSRIHARVNASLNEKSKLMAIATAVLGKNVFRDVGGQKKFHPSDLVGKPCMVTVVHKPSKDGTRMFAEVGSVGRHVKGLPVLTPDAREIVVPRWIQDMIAKRLDPPAAPVQPAPASPQPKGPTTKSHREGDELSPVWAQIAAAPAEGDHGEDQEEG